jgi:hypothetical protein
LTAASKGRFADLELPRRTLGSDLDEIPTVTHDLRIAASSFAFGGLTAVLVMGRC